MLGVEVFGYFACVLRFVEGIFLESDRECLHTLGRVLRGECGNDLPNGARLEIDLARTVRRGVCSTGDLRVPFQTKREGGPGGRAGESVVRVRVLSRLTTTSRNWELAN